MDKFYFKSYGIEVGSASNLKELNSEIARLSKEDPLCVEYHLKEGHIQSWLLYIGEPDAAKQISEAKTVEELMKQLGISKSSGKRVVKSSTSRKKAPSGTKGKNTKSGK
ncbi:hypothetical protein [Cuniculiplasma divulgatum]|jgi:hypothetical protein|uniref:Uncharacterized protein n=1 Tax=Cuniculiplasma divulgatum TaxID=1673428 RepID=A0A1N5VHD1_9ARCH|nr:hypothetical protein [Cuniculiplasma divulgatum]MCI2411985.1 hypothetical protein [Cuniculiplasma sp.]MCL4320041.1 hypothetical protein [Candidatus Thermoplasmatota archaeon]WMT49513.1 MAG: hypothetical protein RE472_00760 [Thermoplasmatales archaeon]MCL6015475.1 hypothetical protein [Candidatus Thermoplasmatota archaeon]SIM72088.1 hypothetical protein CSP5_1372 [Cuniculiplasma divulgatum]